MISCTEFIPAYSELFTFLEGKKGRAEVDRFWEYLFKPDGKGIPLVNFVKREGIRGCFTYWSGTLSEEAADFTLYLNEKAGWFMLKMHKCPSKGRLLALRDEIGIVPYHDYCLHCDSYRSAVAEVGLEYVYNFEGIDHAACSIVIYDPKIFDGRIIIDDDTESLDRRASENEYFHPDFHSSMNMGIHYVGENYGIEAVEKYLTIYTEHVYGKVIDDIGVRGLSAIADKIRDTYKMEKYPDAAEILENGNTLTVKIRFCPAVKHLLATGRAVSPWYRYTTECVMRTLARKAGADFSMIFYDEETGAAEYRFDKKDTL